MERPRSRPPVRTRFSRWLSLVALAVGLSVLSVPSVAQVQSIGKGTLTLELGRASAPVGGIATQVASPGTDASATAHANAFRFLAGYQFAQYLGVEVGIGRMGTFHSSAPYAGTDVLNAADSLVIIEGDLVGHLPFASRARLNLSVGISDTSLHTTFTTQNGTALALGQTAAETDHRLGATAGLDVEYRLTDVTSVLIGFHAYPHIGSSVLRDSASGTATAIFGGIHFEF